MILMKEDLLKVLHEERKLAGNTLEKLIAKHRLNITHPTLSRLLKHYGLLVSPDLLSYAEVIIRNSMFPAWLYEVKGVVVSQPVSWYYTGIFPLGEWVKR